jgi:fatty-acyl-CoA synthase
MTEQTQIDSTVHGIPLADEPLGALTLGGFVREVCQRYPDREAMVFYPPKGEVVRRSYAQVWEESFAIARALVARGVTKQTRVGLLCSNRPEWITAMFGIALAGGTCVALSTFAKGAELEYQIRIGDISLLIFERALLARDFAAELLEICPELSGPDAIVHSTKLPFLRGAICIDEAPAWGPALEKWPDFFRGDKLAPAAIVDAIAAEVASTDQGLLLFSSGSTAKPKAVMHAHRGPAIQSWRAPRIYGVTGDDVRTWSANGFFWSGNFAMALGATFAAGGSLILQRAFDPSEALKLMELEKVTYPIAWPHQWARLAQDPEFPKVNLSSIRYLGETSAMQAHPTINTNWQEPVAAYGNTETFTLSSIHPSGTAKEIMEGNHGYPLPGNTFRVVDPITGKVLKRGEVGELSVKGPTMMLGYLRVAAEDIFDDDGFFRTGDGGFVDNEGRVHWHGRLNDIIKTGGANVSPLEIDAILRECPGVKVAATVGVPHETLGELVVACIVPKADAKLDESTVRAFVAKQLSSFKVPRRVLFVAESDLELTASNKVKTAPLRELAAKRLADESK